MVSENPPKEYSEELITCKQAAAQLKVSVFTIKRWLREDKLGGTKPGGYRWKVFQSSCNKMIRESKNLNA